jgi:ABC-type polysaccharide/polyol phosphate export permease
MTPPRRWARLLLELRKIPAFVRRDALIAWSYRTAFISEITGTFLQVGVFFFLSFLVDPTRMPRVGQTRADYMGFVAVGLSVALFYQIGVARLLSGVRNEQLMGTFEALLSTPTSPTTIQLGMVAYDLLRIPLRAGLLLGIAAGVFGVHLRWAGLGQALVLAFALLPFAWGMAAAMTALVVTVRQATGLIGFANYALLIGSGTYFPLEMFPQWLAVPLALNPLALALQGTRDALLGEMGWSETFRLAVLILPVAISTWAVGTMAFRYALQRERRAGTLGLY